MKLKKICSIASLLPFVIILCAIEMGGCDGRGMAILKSTIEAGEARKNTPCYDGLVRDVTTEKEEANINKNKALIEAETAKTATGCEERMAAATAAREHATKARGHHANAAKRIAGTTDAAD